MGKSKNTLVNKIYYNSPLLIKNMIATLYGYREYRKRYGNHYKNILSELKLTEFLSTEELQEIQTTRLKLFLEFSSVHSTFYYNLFKKHDFNASAFDDTELLKKLPILEKEVVRNNSVEISCKRVLNKTYNVKTSGSTGKPLSLSITNHVFQQNQAIQHLLYYWNGLSDISKMAKCAGQSVTPIENRNPPFWVTDYYNNNLYLSSYHLSEDNLKYYIQKLERFNPDVLEGYPSSLYLLALANKNYNGKITPKFIRTGSETLLDYQRYAIEDSFDCKVHNFYGSGENCVRAVECPSGKIHLQMLYGYTELLDNNNKPIKPGETGKIIATGFSNYAFPLIRYDTGDIAILSKNQVCDCGRGGILLDTITGRLEDYIITPKGNMVGRMDHIFKGVDGVRNGQIIQEVVGQIIINIAKDEIYNKKSENKILENIKERLGGEIEIEIKYVNEIPKEKNGKYKFIISRLGKEIFGGKINK